MSGKRTVIYISGPMSGYFGLNFESFHAATASLRERGYQVISPAEIKQKATTWAACMRQDIKALMDADKVAVLPGWEKSKGAQIEVKLAQSLGMEIIDAYTFEVIA